MTETQTASPALNTSPQAPVGDRIVPLLRRAARYISLPALLFVWWLIARFELVDPLLLPGPGEVLSAGKSLLLDGTLLSDTRVSLTRVFIGFGMAAALAIPIAALMGMTRFFTYMFDPIIEFWRPVPPVALIPLAILWFGIGEFSKLFIVAYAAFFPIVLNAVAGFRAVEEVHIRAAQVLGAGRFQQLRHVALPTAFPYLAVGLRLGMGMAFLSLVAAELIAASSGLGYLIQNAKAQFQTDRVIVGVLVIAVLGFMLNTILVKIEERVVRWR